MRRTRLWISMTALVVVGGAGVWLYQPTSDRTQIAAGLLKYHQQFATNGYSATGTYFSVSFYLPASLIDRYEKDTRSSSSAETNYALVEYNYRRFGMRCNRMFTIERTRSDDNVWTLTNRAMVWARVSLCALRELQGFR